MPDDGPRPPWAVRATSPAGDVAPGSRAGMMWTLALRRFRSHLRATSGATPADIEDTEDTDGRAR